MAPAQMADFLVKVSAHAQQDFLGKRATHASMAALDLFVKHARPLRLGMFAAIKVYAMVMAHSEVQENASVFQEFLEISVTSVFLVIMAQIAHHALVSTLIMAASPALVMARVQARENA